MALPQNDVDLVNLSLAMLGHNAAITSLSDTSVEAKAAARFLDLVRDQALAAFDWTPWAEKRAVLTQLTGSGVWWDLVAEDWGYVYQLPTDFVRSRALWPGTRNPVPADAIPFDLRMDSAVTAKVLVTDVAPATNEAPVLRYTFRNSTVTQYPAPFCDYFAALLACRLCVPVTKKAEKLRELWAYAGAAFVEAVRQDNLGRRPDLEPPSPSLQARGMFRRSTE